MTPPALSKERIVAAALAVLDEGGLDGLTLRAVATRLGVQAPALYWHVKNKQDLLDEMGTSLWRSIYSVIGALPDDTPWNEGMAAFATELRRTLLAHRDGAKVFSGTYLTDASILQQQEEPLARMIAEGFTLTDALRISALVYNFTVGFCIEEQAVRQSDDDRYTPETRSGRFSDAENPLVVASGAEMFGDQDARFQAMLDILLDAGARLQSRK